MRGRISAVTNSSYTSPPSYKNKIKKIGHAGTLDPLAEGLLIIGIGKHTKKLAGLQGLNKTYEGVIEIGKTTWVS